MLAPIKTVLAIAAAGIFSCIDAGAVNVIARGVLVTHDWTVQIGTDYNHRLGLMGGRDTSGVTDTVVYYGFGGFPLPAHIYIVLAIISLLFLAVAGLYFYGRSYHFHKAV